MLDLREITVDLLTKTQDARLTFDQKGSLIIDTLIHVQRDLLETLQEQQRLTQKYADQLEDAHKSILILQKIASDAVEVARTSIGIPAEQ